MSLSDYVKRLRAFRGGVTPNEIEEATGIPASKISYVERKYRKVGEEDQLLATLADYFGVPAEEMWRRRETHRKNLTTFLADRAKKPRKVRLSLFGGGDLVGWIVWNDRTAIGLKLADGTGEVVVYRHAVEEWRDAQGSAPTRTGAVPGTGGEGTDPTPALPVDGEGAWHTPDRLLCNQAQCPPVDGSQR